jgi:hypothetical protein
MFFLFEKMTIFSLKIDIFSPKMAIFAPKNAHILKKISNISPKKCPSRSWSFGYATGEKCHTYFLRICGYPNQNLDENMAPIPKPVHLNSSTPNEEDYYDLPKTSDIDEHESHEIDFKTQSEILKLPEEKLGELLEETSEIPPDLIQKPEMEKTTRENYIEEQSPIEQQEQIEKEVQEEFHRYMDKIVHEAFSEAMNHVEATSLNVDENKSLDYQDLETASKTKDPTDNENEEELDSIKERAKPNEEDDEPQGTSSSYVIQDHVHLPENIEVITITDTETPDELENFNEEGQNLNTTDLHEREHPLFTR